MLGETSEINGWDILLGGSPHLKRSGQFWQSTDFIEGKQILEVDVNSIPSNLFWVASKIFKAASTPRAATDQPSRT
jgi:hypothetical protein